VGYGMDFEHGRLTEWASEGGSAAADSLRVAARTVKGSGWAGSRFVVPPLGGRGFHRLKAELPTSIRAHRACRGIGWPATAGGWAGMRSKAMLNPSLFMAAFWAVFGNIILACWPSFEENDASSLLWDRRLWP